MRASQMIRAATLSLVVTLLISACACGGSGSGSGGGLHPATYSFSVLHGFTGPDGARPWASLVRDAAGNLYGTTSVGGAFDSGTVFKLDPKGNETVLYNFTGGADGWFPAEGELTLDNAGNLYGAAGAGGSGRFGVVFRLDATGTETVLYNFTGGVDGGGPHGSVVLDAAGNLYGTAQMGGAFGSGVVFKLDTAGNEIVLHAFRGGGDGVQPVGSLLLDKAGNLYGVTFSGGSAGQGILFRIDAAGNETVLHTFTGPDGAVPAAALVQDSNGNLYGTTELGGAYSQGTVFKIDSAGNETVLYSFTGMLDGRVPIGKLALDSKGNLFGTTDSGGNSSNCFFGCGVVFKLDPTGKQTVLHNFVGTDGSQVLGLILDSQGNLYGTASAGGPTSCNGFTSDCGSAFKLTLMP